MSAKVYDIESLCDDLELLFKSKLNTKLAAIDTEKDDDITLKPIVDKAYFFQSLDGKQANYNPYLFYGVQNIEPNPDPYNMGHTPESLSIWAAIVCGDEGIEENPSKRMFRYGRALKEVIEENFDNNKFGIKLTVMSQVPIELSLLNESSTDRAVGVIIKADLA